MKRSKVILRDFLIIIAAVLIIIVLALVGYNIYCFPAALRHLSDKSLSESETVKLKDDILARTDKKILIAYFSHSGTTKNVAEELSKKNRRRSV